MKEIRCAFVASYFGPYYSNFVASMLAFEKEMQRRGHHTVYVFPEDVKEFDWIPMLEELTDKIFYLPYRPNSLNNFIALRRIFRREKINLIYSHMCGWDFAAHFAAPTTPIIWHMRMGVNTTNRKRVLKNRLKFRFFGFGKTYHIAVSEAVAEGIEFYRPKHPCTVIFNGVDFSRLKESRSEAKTGEPLRLLIFGWSPEVKGLDTALNACAALNSDSVKVQLLISAQEETEQYMQSRFGDDVPNWVTMLASTSDVAGLYDRADAMVSASRSEGFSFSLAESIYSGLPVVYSDIPGTRWADEFRAVYRFKKGKSADLAAAITRLMQTPITEEDKAFNRALMKQKYSLDAWTEAVLSEVERIANEN